MKKHVMVPLFSLLALLFALSFAAAPAPALAEDYVPNIMDIAASDDRFDTLEAAVKAGGLADALAAPGEMTVFAPTDDAFAKLPAETLNSLLADPEGALTQVLLYHVASGTLGSSSVLGMDSITTLQGSDLTVSLRDGLPYVNDSQIILTDIAAKNGVIHVIDTVLVPDMTAPAATVATTDADMSVTATGSIVDIAVANGNFDTLVQAVTAAGLADTLAGPGNFTVFAPTDAAFDALPAGALESLLADPTGELKTILLHHVVGDALSANQIATDDYIPALDGRPLTVNRDGNTIMDISGAQLVMYDIQASNGVIHVIDKVIIP